mmetsp:Transcript_73225/g.214676  ORF Transcript_73225/g.214676 Transcript_73225/m.214676 type:complete len:716 (+) Transcript_73225:50-2197(+)
MLNILRYGIEVSKHSLQGVHILSTKEKKKPDGTSSPPCEIMCTLLEGCTVGNAIDSGLPEPGPITVTYRGMPATLRPWDPHSCVMAAAIDQGFLHFPIRPCGRVFVVGCSLTTLSHISDILGPSGRLIGIISDGVQHQKPTPEMFRTFFLRYPHATIISTNTQYASFECYQRLLSLPDSSKMAFLMAFHSRLGAASPARKLSVDRKKLVGLIFSFILCDDAADVNTLVFGQWPDGTSANTVCEAVLAHIDILRQWTRLRRAAAKLQDEAQSGSNSDIPLGAEEGKDTASSAAEQHRKSRARSTQEGDSQLKWVLLDVPSESTVNSSSSGEVFGQWAQLTSKLRRGLVVKEQLVLRPHLPHRSLLLLKYSRHHDSRAMKADETQRAPEAKESEATVAAEAKAAQELEDITRSQEVREPKHWTEPKQAKKSKEPKEKQREAGGTKDARVLPDPKKTAKTAAPKEQKESSESKEARASKDALKGQAAHAGAARSSQGSPSASELPAPAFGARRPEKGGRRAAAGEGSTPGGSADLGSGAAGRLGHTAKSCRTDDSAARPVASLFTEGVAALDPISEASSSSAVPGASASSIALQNPSSSAAFLAALLERAVHQAGDLELASRLSAVNFPLTSDIAGGQPEAGSLSSRLELRSPGLLASALCFIGGCGDGRTGVRGGGPTSISSSSSVAPPLGPELQGGLYQDGQLRSLEPEEASWIWL